MKESSPSFGEQTEGMPESTEPHESFEKSWRAVVGEKEIPPGIPAKAKNEHAVLNRINTMIATGMMGLTFLAASPSKTEAQALTAQSLQEKIIQTQRRTAESEARRIQMEKDFEKENKHWDEVLQRAEKANQDAKQLVDDLDGIQKDLKGSREDLNKIVKQRKEDERRIDKMTKDLHTYNQNLRAVIDALKRGAPKEEVERLRKNLK